MKDTLFLLSLFCPKDYSCIIVSDQEAIIRAVDMAVGITKNNIDEKQVCNAH